MTPGPAHGRPLTPRELEVALLAARALPDQEIADRLGISRRTVHVHLWRAYAKTGTANRVQLILWLGRDAAP